MELLDIKNLCERIRANINRVIVGKEDVIDLVLVTLIVSGHVLLEDVPGTTDITATRREKSADFYGMDRTKITIA